MTISAVNRLVFSKFRFFKMSQSAKAFSNQSFLIDDPKYGFLKDLGIERSNLGVYNGKWTASGSVSSFKIICNYGFKYVITNY